MGRSRARRIINRRDRERLLELRSGLLWAEVALNIQGNWQQQLQTEAWATNVGSGTRWAEIRYDGMHSNLIIQRFRSRVVVLSDSGCDVGEFGEAPMEALNDSVTSSDPIDLFIDAREVRGASIDVSGRSGRAG